MLISCAVNAQLICVFVFAYAKNCFSHDAAHISFGLLTGSDTSLAQNLIAISILYIRNRNPTPFKMLSFIQVSQAEWPPIGKQLLTRLTICSLCIGT